MLQMLALRARPACARRLQRSVYQPATAETEAGRKEDVIATGNVTNLEKLDSFQLQGEISAGTRIARISEERLRCANLNYKRRSSCCASSDSDGPLPPLQLRLQEASADDVPGFVGSYVE